MPVIDLADYLGMPQQAPANPVFNQTRKSTGSASLDREIDDFYKGAAAIDQLRSLQRQAPVFEAQKAQIAYDKVAQDARDLRMKQEIEAQVERAANELAGGNLNPESEDFGAKYRDLATRNPLAFSDPRFRQVAGLYEGQNQSYRQTRAAQAEDERVFAAKEAEGLRTAIGDYLESGGAAEKAQGIKSIEEAKYLKGQLSKPGRGGAGAISADERRLKNILDARSADFDRVATKLELPEDDPRYIKAQENLALAQDNYIKFNESGGVPVVTQQGSGRALGGAGIPVRPKEQAIVQPTQVPITPEGQIDIDKIPFGEIDKTIERVNEQAKAQEEVAKAWNSAQMDLEKKLEKLYPGNIGNTNYSKLARFAKAVMNEELMEDTGKDIVLDENGQPLRVLVGQAALEKLGLSPEGDAFTEPGKARINFFGIGSQIVPNKQLLETWARNYLKRAPVNVAPTQAPISSEMNLAIEDVLNTK